jgi:hypothetical protein
MRVVRVKMMACHLRGDRVIRNMWRVIGKLRRVVVSWMRMVCLLVRIPVQGRRDRIRRRCSMWWIHLMDRRGMVIFR